MHPAIKIAFGALMVIIGVFSSVTFWEELLTLVQASIGPLLVLVGAFIVWLESDELKMRREQKKQQRKGFEKFANESDQKKKKKEKKEKKAAEEPEEQEGHTCSDCGKTFDTQRGLSIHRAQKHK